MAARRLSLAWRRAVWVPAILVLLAACDERGICVDGQCERLPADAGPRADAGVGDALAVDAVAADRGLAGDRTASDVGAPDTAAPDVSPPDAARPDQASAADRAPADAAPGDAGPRPEAGWLRTQGNRILRPDDSVWVGRGANLHDTRSCNACTWAPPDVAEVKRRIDVLVDDWGADFLRLDLESYAEASGRTHWQSVLDDPAYLDDVVELVAHVGQKPGVYVLLSLWASDFFSDLGWPTAHSRQEWQVLAAALVDVPHVLFGICNEPESNFSGAQDAEVWDAMNQAVQVIRDVEDASGSPHHIVAVQGTGGWARRLGYYVDHPITAGGGDNIAYEIHVYNPAADFDSMLVVPAQTLPVIIGEYGPVSGTMSDQDVLDLQALADQHGIPSLAWTFHMRCAPNLLVDNSGGGCGVGMALAPTAWGNVLMDYLSP